MSQENPPKSSAKEAEEGKDDPISDPNVPNSSSILNPQNQNQNQSHPISSNLETGSQNALSPDKNQNQNRRVQESSNLKRGSDFSEYEARMSKYIKPVILPGAKKPKIIVTTPADRKKSKPTDFVIPDFPAPGKRNAGVPRQSPEQTHVGRLEERDHLHALQESRETFEKQEKGATVVAIRDFPAPGKRTAGVPRQSSERRDVGREIEERELLHALQESRKTFKKQKKEASGNIVGESSAPESRLSDIYVPSSRTNFDHGIQETGPSNVVIQETGKEKKEEEKNWFLLSSSRSEEEDDYQTLKFASAFIRASFPARFGISLSDFIKRELPECQTITERRCQQKLSKLFGKFLDLSAKFRGVERQEGREYEMFELGNTIWVSENVDPDTHGSVPEESDPGIPNAALEDPEGNEADPESNVDPGAGDPGVNVDPNPGSNVQQGGEAVRVQNVGEDPTGNREGGADPRENMDP